MGYFKELYNLSKFVDIENEEEFDYFFLGFGIIFSPFAIPVYYTGKVGAKMMERLYGDWREE